MRRTRDIEVGHRNAIPATLAVMAILVAGVVLASVLSGTVARGAVAGATLLFLVMLDIPTVKRVLIAIMILEIPIQVDVYLSHDGAIAEAGGLSGFNISITTFCLVALYGLWAAELMARTTRISRSALKLAIPSSAYIVVVFLSASVAADSLLAASELVILIQAFLLFLYIIHYVRSREDALFVVAMIVLGLLLQSLIVLSVQATGAPVTVGPVKAGIGGERLHGTFGSPNVLGSYLAITLAPALGLMMTPTRWPYRWLGGVGFGLGTIALALSFSRGAWVGFVASTVFVLLYGWRQGWLPAAAPIVLGIVTLVLLALLKDQIAQRLAVYDNSAAQARFPLMELAFRMIGGNPILGVGPNNFSTSLDQYVTVDFSQDWIYTVHNKYLLVWTESGIGGLLAFLWFVLAAVRRGWQQITANDRFLSPLALGLTAGLIANLIHMMVDIFQGRPQIQMLWLVAGLLLAFHLMSPARHSTGEVIATRNPV